MKTAIIIAETAFIAFVLGAVCTYRWYREDEEWYAELKEEWERKNPA